MTDTVLVPLAPGFEEIEAVTIVDVLRRAGVPVTVAGLAPGPVRGSHGITLETDCTLDEVDPERVGMLVLPGGMPGAANLAGDERVLGLVRRLHREGRAVAAICAAPLVLGAAGILAGTPATCYPGFEDRLGGAEPRTDRVVRAGRIVTSRGPGTALEFALALVEDWKGGDAAAALRESMLVASS